jgi:predicted chitinase
MVTREQLEKLHINPDLVDVFNETFDRWSIATPRQQAAFIGQCGHESGNFRVLEENLNYAADRLMIPSQPAQDCQQGLRQPDG